MGKETGNLFEPEEKKPKKPSKDNDSPYSQSEIDQTEEPGKDYPEAPEGEEPRAQKKLKFE